MQGELRGTEQSPTTKEPSALNVSSSKTEKPTVKSKHLISSFKTRYDLASSTCLQLARLSFYASLLTPSRPVVGNLQLTGHMRLWSLGLPLC